MKKDSKTDMPVATFRGKKVKSYFLMFEGDDDQGCFMTGDGERLIKLAVFTALTDKDIKGFFEEILRLSNDSGIQESYDEMVKNVGKVATKKVIKKGTIKKKKDGVNLGSISN